jgi:hypothetical protein
MPPIPRWKVILQIGLAVLICLLILAITIPDLGRYNLSYTMSRSGKPQGITYGWQDGMCIFINRCPARFDPGGDHPLKNCGTSWVGLAAYFTGVAFDPLGRCAAVLTASKQAYITLDDENIQLIKFPLPHLLQTSICAHQPDNTTNGRLGEKSKHR